MGKNKNKNKGKKSGGQGASVQEQRTEEQRPQQEQQPQQQQRPQQPQQQQRPQQPQQEREPTAKQLKSDGLPSLKDVGGSLPHISPGTTNVWEVQGRGNVGRREGGGGSIGQGRNEGGRGRGQGGRGRGQGGRGGNEGEGEWRNIQDQGAARQAQGAWGGPQGSQGQGGPQRSEAIPSQRQGAWGGRQENQSTASQGQVAWGASQGNQGATRQGQGALGNPQRSQSAASQGQAAGGDSQENQSATRPGQGISQGQRTQSDNKQSKLGAIPKKQGGSGVSETKSSTNVPRERTPQLSVQPRKKLRRPDEGLTARDGKPVMLRTNHFEMSFPENETLFHYDVDFVEFARCPKKLKRRVVNEIIRRESSHFEGMKPVYDGQKSLYTMKRIQGDDSTITLSVDFVEDLEENRSRKFTIKIKYAAMYSTKELHDFLRGYDTTVPSQVLQIFEIAVKQQLLLNYIQSGRSIYFDEHFLGRRHERCLQGGLSAWYGAFTSVRPGGQWKLTLNVDMSTTAFVDSLMVIDYLGEVLKLTARRNDPPFNPRMSLPNDKRLAFTKEIKNLKVRVIHQGGTRRKYKVCGVSHKNAQTHSFKHDKTTVTVMEYFRSQYGVSLQFPNLPLLQVGKKEREIFLPMEVCQIVEGQKYPRKIAEGIQAANMVKSAALKPNFRERNIQDILRKLDLSKNEEMRHLHLLLPVDNQPMKVKAHVLYPPTLRAARNQPIKPRFGMGQWDLNRAHFHDAVPLTSWGVINFSGRTDPRPFIGKLRNQAVQLGMNIAEPRFVDTKYANDAYNALSRYKNDRLQLVICIVVAKGRDYEKIKSFGDVEFGIPTQCILAKNVDRAMPQLITNLLLKINTKIGGKINILHEPEKLFPRLKDAPMLLLGADVTHPTKDDLGSPSIAALVGNMDISLSRYVADVKVQGPREETITGLQHMVRNMLLNFHRENGGSKPKHIIMYRDGVSEGQFDIMIVHELQAIQKACRSLNEDYKPHITFIVVQKRHHTRFFPEDMGDATRNGNILAGTVVDTGVTHPFEFDFFLNSHVAIQGTSKPAHYHVLYDDFGFTSKEMTNLTNFLCHMCFRCTRVISYPAPTYYAHLAAFRARSHLAALMSDTMSVASSGSGEVQIDYPKLQRAITPRGSVSNSMYFN